MYYRKEWKKYRSEYDLEAKEKIAKLSVYEKVSLMSGKLSLDDILGSIRKKSRTHYNEVPYTAGGTEDIPDVRFVDGTRGVVCGKGTYTCFPVVVMRGATFNKELEEKVGRAMGLETIIAGGNLFAGICLNLPYHPGWGRSQETYGEDTIHISRMGAAIVAGVQSTGVIACIKHFAFNSMENIRHDVNVIADEKSEREIYLRQFETAIKTGAGAVMTAYNMYKGEKCGQSEYLIKDILINKWGFDGFVMADFTWGITDTIAAIRAGQNIEMPNSNYYGQKLLDAIRNGEVSEGEIDDSVIRIVRTVLAHENLIEKTRTDIKDINKILEAHRELAKEVAREGITLLKNENVLPLKCRDAKSKIVVLGEMAGIENTGDIGSSQVYPPYVITPLQGIINNCGKAEVIYYEGKNINHCKRLAKDATAVIVVTGNNYMTEGERISSDSNIYTQDTPGGDRCGSLRIPDIDMNIINAVSEVRDDTVVILEGGSTIIVDDFIDKIGTLLFCYYPGMEGGNAIAEVLFGVVNPSGKLPFVIPKREEDLQIMDWSSKEQHYDYFHGYTLLDRNNVEPRFGYGYGLSYTTFEIKEISTTSVGGIIKSKVSIRNTGKLPGAEVVKIYLTCDNPDANMPNKWLADFQKVHLSPGETKEIILEADTTYYNLPASNFSSIIE